MTDRAALRGEFLHCVRRDDVPLQPLPADASARRYFRLAGSSPPMLLMDAPPPGETIGPFVEVARHLASLGLSPPAIYETDAAQGFALIEDFGDATYTRLLDGGADAGPLLTAATDVLVRLHTHPAGMAIAAPAYDRAKMLDEIAELPDWYGLAVAGTPLSTDAREDFIGVWRDLLESLPAPESGLVLLDYHLDNLMALPGRTGAAACGLLDFQDARIGPRPYDLLCLLRNERRGIDPALSQALYDRYIAAAQPADAALFGVWYRVLAAQRYTKVLGRFARLTLRDHRDGYLRYLPRVVTLLDGMFEEEPLLRPIGEVLAAILPDWLNYPPDDAPALRQRVASSAGQS